MQHDECGQACVLDAYVGDRFLQYWTRFPSGSHVGEALGHAGEDIASVAGDDCEIKNDLGLLTHIRESLAKVTHPAKDGLLSSLKQIEIKCAK